MIKLAFVKGQRENFGSIGLTRERIAIETPFGCFRWENTKQQQVVMLLGKLLDSSTELENNTEFTKICAGPVHNQLCDDELKDLNTEETCGFRIAMYTPTQKSTIIKFFRALPLRLCLKIQILMNLRAIVSHGTQVQFPREPDHPVKLLS